MCRGDHPADIASGPTVGDASTCAGCAGHRAALSSCRLPPQVLARTGKQRGRSRFKPDDPRLAAPTHLIAAPQQALEAAARVAQQHGIACHILSDAIEGEARDVGQVLAALALQVARARPAFSAAVRAAQWRRNHRHPAQHPASGGPGRAQCGMPAGLYPGHAGGIRASMP